MPTEATWRIVSFRAKSIGVEFDIPFVRGGFGNEIAHHGQAGNNNDTIDRSIDNIIYNNPLTYQAILKANVDVMIVLGRAKGGNANGDTPYP
jgi:hypothetical protein